MPLTLKWICKKIVTLDGFGVRADPRDHFGKNATLNKRRIIVKVLQPFEVVRGPRGPRISILGLTPLSYNEGTTRDCECR